MQSIDEPLPQDPRLLKTFVIPVGAGLAIDDCIPGLARLWQYAMPCGSGRAREASDAVSGTGFAGVRGQARSHSSATGQLHPMQPESPLSTFLPIDTALQQRRYLITFSRHHHRHIPHPHPWLTLPIQQRRRSPARPAHPPKPGRIRFPRSTCPSRSTATTSCVSHQRKCRFSGTW